MQADNPDGEVESGGAASTTFAGGNSSSRIRSYECNFCRRGFLNAQALGGHMNIHRKDRANKTLMKPAGAYNYQFGNNYCSASSSIGNVDMKKRREAEGVDEGEQRKLDVDAGEPDLELRLWPDSTGRKKDSNSRLKDFF